MMLCYRLYILPAHIIIYRTGKTLGAWLSIIRMSEPEPKEVKKCTAADNGCRCNGCQRCLDNARDYHKKMGDDPVEDFGWGD